MIRIFQTNNSTLYPVDSLDNMTSGCWIELTNPTSAEASRLEHLLDVEHDDIMAALDPEEKNRVEMQDDYTMILIDVPALEKRHNKQRYTTIPLSMILTDDHIITVCTEKTPIMQYFHHNRVKGFSTKKRLRFVYQIMLETALRYQKVLRRIDAQRTEFEEHIENIRDEADLINLHELESTLVYIATSLRGNANVLDRLQRYGRLQKYPEDRELLEDVIVENQQAIEMAQIYRNIIDGTRELVSSIMDNRLNSVMKRLTSITLILAIPTMISGMYGMNVDGKWMPLAHAKYGFEIIGAIIVVICVILVIFLDKKKML